VKMWGDSKFRSLSAPEANAQTLWFFLLTGPQTTRIPGLIASGEAGLSEVIDWNLEGFRKAFQELFQKGMVKADWKARLIWIPKAIFYNRPENPNVVKGWKDTWDEMPECELKQEAFQQLENFMKDLGESFHKAFQEACSKPSGKTLPNQEQEQEQEQETISPSEAGLKTSSPKLESDPMQARTHSRLILFADEYLLAKGQNYIVGNYQAEGGAAKRTMAKIPDDSLYRQAVRAYLAHNEKRLTDNGHSFLWFIRELNRWVMKAQGDTNARKNAVHYDELCE